jgi:hypothetical protein
LPRAYTFYHSMKKTLFIFLVLLISIFSCKTDFEINANWKDVTVVYGLLNQNDSIHYIKINKAFLGNENALIMAQNPDSASYGNNLEVWVEEWKNGSQSNQWYLDTTTIYNKEAGVFYSPKQVLYKFQAFLYESAEYRLNIKNKITGKTISGKTLLVHDFSVEKPSSMQPANFNATNPIQVKWLSAVNGKLYQVVVRFNYWEKTFGATDSTLKYADWDLGSFKSTGLDGNETMETSYNGNSFFSFLANKIEHNSNIIRHVAVPNVDFIFSVAADDFNTYMEVSAPTTGIVQEKPEYTNISSSDNSAIGLFSSRYQLHRKLAMNPISLDSLYNGSYTSILNFQ